MNLIRGPSRISLSITYLVTLRIHTVGTYLYWDLNS